MEHVTHALDDSSGECRVAQVAYDYLADMRCVEGRFGDDVYHPQAVAEAREPSGNVTSLRWFRSFAEHRRAH